MYNNDFMEMCKKLETLLVKAIVKLASTNTDFSTVEHRGEITDDRSDSIENNEQRKQESERIGVLFSGGVDSTLIAKVLIDKGFDFTCYTTGIKGSKDINEAVNAAEELGLDLKISELSSADVERDIEKVAEIIKDNNIVKLSIGTVFYPACEKAHNDGITVLFTGLGSEEIFAGYMRHLKVNIKDINQECRRGLMGIYERDLCRDEALANHFRLKLALPFLDKRVVEYSLRIPGEYKIKDGYKKYILRKIAESLGVPKKYAWRKKIAAQYGSGIDKTIEKIAKRKGFKYKSKYAETLYTPKIGALISTGKDSLYALYKMMKRGFNVECLITVYSKNPFSYMFHTPTIKLAKLQAEAIGLPLITVKTTGRKEEELKDLKKAIQKAINEYQIDGICTGALFSEYQKKRIDKICEQLKVKHYAPLWHMNQEKELRDLLKDGFEIMFTYIGSEGIDDSWLGRIITQKDVNKLVDLNRKYGINIAGEGGEYESLVLNMPLFKRRIIILEWKREDHRMIIKHATLSTNQ